MFAYFVSDDLLRNVPREQRMPIERLTTPVMQLMFDPTVPRECGYPGSDQFKPMTDPAARVAWMDEVGIAYQHVISGAGYTLARAIDDVDLSHRALEAVNTWMTDAASDHRDRIRPVTSLRFDDLDWVVGELTRMRERGSRAFLVSAEPAGGIPPMHPDFDKVWAAATDLGMIAHLHVGMNPGLFHPGVGEHRRPRDHPSDLAAEPAPQRAGVPDRGGVRRRVRTSPEPHRARVGARHRLVPRLGEQGRRMAAPGVSPLVVGDYRWPLHAARVRRAQRAHLADPGAARVAAARSWSRCPASRCSRPTTRTTRATPTPLAYYDQELAPLDDAARSRFLGGSIAESYARMGDPV